MPNIIYFVALPIDVADGSVVVGEPIECLSPAAREGEPSSSSMPTARSNLDRLG
jgi:hypothetical protein